MYRFRGNDSQMTVTVFHEGIDLPRESLEIADCLKWVFPAELIQSATTCGRFARGGVGGRFRRSP